MLPKLDLIYSIIGIFSKIQYKFKNRVVLEVLKKLVIVVINLLIYYLIVEMGYVRVLLINKLMFISIEFEIFREANCNYDSSTKPKRKISAR